MTTVDDAVEDLARAASEVVARLEAADLPDDSPEARLRDDLRAALDEWVASK